MDGTGAVFTAFEDYCTACTASLRGSQILRVAWFGDFYAIVFLMDLQASVWAGWS
jgi:hypothetical protein